MSGDFQWTLAKAQAHGAGGGKGPWGGSLGSADVLHLEDVLRTAEEITLIQPLLQE